MPSSTCGCSSSGSSWEPGWSGSSSWTRAGANPRSMPSSCPREAAWLSAVMREDGYDVSPEAAERLLLLHRAYLDAPPPDAPTAEDRATPVRSRTPTTPTTGRRPDRVRSAQSSPTRTGSVSTAEPVERRPVRRRTSRRSTARDRRRRPDPVRQVPAEEHLADALTRARRSRPSSGIPGRPVAASGRWRRPRARPSTARRRGCRRRRVRGAGEGDALGIGLGRHGQGRSW